MFHAENAEIAEANPATGPVVDALGVRIQGPWPNDGGGASWLAERPGERSDGPGALGPIALDRVPALIAGP